MQYDWCPYVKKRSRDLRAQKGRTVHDDNSSSSVCQESPKRKRQVRPAGFRGSTALPAWMLILDSLASRTMRNKRRNAE